jgi:hypothetical protein
MLSVFATIYCKHHKYTGTSAAMTTTTKSGVNYLRKQTGMLTTFTAVMILSLLALMMVFATQIGIFDQRISSSDELQKQAFHVAESGIHHAKEFLRKNPAIVASATTDQLPDGTDGWLSGDGQRWLPCVGAYAPDGSGKKTHPCYGEPVQARRDLMFFYSHQNSPNIPVTTNVFMPDETENVTVQALLCVLDIDYESATPVQGEGCSTNVVPFPAGDGEVDGTYSMVTLLARGEADCVGGANCKAEALVREQVSNFGGAAGGQAPSVPLTTKSTFPPSGSAEIVPNPNSGGVGVPVSVWINDNPSCGGATIDPSSGSWATCEAHEWYGENQLPEDYTCNGNCSCSSDESLSYTHGSTDILGIDLVDDPDFPCDLFNFYFGIPRANYEIVKGYSQVLSDCSTLGPNSTGIFWISGEECRINSNTQVGSPATPVLLISAAAETRLNGGAVIYGVFYVSDTEEPNAALYSNGTNTIYGQTIVDASLGSYTGTFQVVYNENAISRAAGTGGLGSVIGGWADIHPEWE